MTQKIEKSVMLFLEGVLFSYAQVFFSKHKAFALLLIVVTFFDWISGLSGMVAVVTANLAAVVMGFHRNSVSQGFYGFNSLLVGLGMGLFYRVFYRSGVCLAVHLFPDHLVAGLFLEIRSALPELAIPFWYLAGQFGLRGVLGAGRKRPGYFSTE